MNTNNCNQNNYFKKLMKVVYLLPFLLLNSYVTATQPCPFDTGANTSMMIVAALAGFMVLFVWVLFCIKKYKILLRNSHKVLLILGGVIVSVIIILLALTSFMYFALMCV